MKKVLFVAPHADDETLGCGGTILKLAAQGYEVHWMLVTGMSAGEEFSQFQVDARDQEIKLVAEKFGFYGVHQLGFAPSSLDAIPKSQLVSAISSSVSQIKPDHVYVTFRNDAHSDHEIVFDAVMASTKIFRHPYLKRILCYETLSETDFSLKFDQSPFRPNSFVNIDNFLKEKLHIMEIYHSEVGKFPFPRSGKAIEALASLRGVQAGCSSAEAFMLLKEVD